MPPFVVSRLLPLFLLLTPFAVVHGQEPETPAVSVVSDLTLNGPGGAYLRFAESAGAWRWTGLAVPAATGEAAITLESTLVGVNGTDHFLAAAWTLVEQTAAKIVFEQEVPDAGLAFRRIYSFGPAAHIARIETWVRSTDDEKTLTRAPLLDLRVADETFQETGALPASFPLFGRTFFVGIEHVSGVCRLENDVVRLWQTPHVKAGDTWKFIAAAVVGWPLPTDCSLITDANRIRRAFYDYLDTIRVKPAGFELHTNTWWTLPLPFSEKDVLRDIEALRQGFTERTGMFFDSFALDLGWSDPHSIWQVDAKRFPTELRAINENLGALGSKLGLWVSPGSAYPEGLDNYWLASAGYELTALDNLNNPLSRIACFALGGRYQREFKDNIVRLARDYGLRHVKLDFMIHTCDVPTHGHPVGFDSYHTIDAGLADVLDSLRAVNPEMALEPLCTGYPPSPWWTTKTPYVLGPYGDDVPYGRVPSPEWMESLITARDIAYRADREKWIMPTQAIETIDIVRQNPGDFENLAVMAIGRGRWFISTYLKPELMTPQNWDFFAALVRWARANKKYLGQNAELIGGRPEKREAYGYMFHHPEKEIYCVRNPWLETRSLALPTCTAVTEVRDLRMIYPRREFVARLVPGAEAPVLSLAGYETVILETVPAAEIEPVAPFRSAPDEIVAAEPTVSFVRTDNELQPTTLYYDWSGSVTVPAIASPEICVLVEGGPQVATATGRVLVNGRVATSSSKGSSGQFGAAAVPSPENWKWFFVPVAAGSTKLEVSVEIPAAAAQVSIYLRGSTPASQDPEPDVGPVFPLFHPDRRQWTQVVVPTTDIRTAEVVATPDSGT